MSNKLLLVGDWHSSVHEEPFSDGLSRAGMLVEKFKWHVYFKNYAAKGYLAEKISRIQDKYMFGFLVNRLNNDLLKEIYKRKPSVIFIYRGSHIYASTVLKIKTTFPNIYIIGYNNDDPFSKLYPKWKWRHFNKAIPYYDLVLAYRDSNLKQFVNEGAKLVDLLRSWYLPWIHRKISPDTITSDRYFCDVVFIGHYESDGRMEMLDALAAKGISVKIFGPSGPSSKSGWDEALASSTYLANLSVKYLRGEEYVAAINSAKIALCFLSKLNNDTYTRRCFEIPACGTALFSEYSDDLANLFEDGKSIVLFRNTDELVSKVSYYLDNPDQLADIAEQGKLLMERAGHDVYSRASWLVAKYQLASDPGKIHPDYE